MTSGKTSRQRRQAVTDVSDRMIAKVIGAAAAVALVLGIAVLALGSSPEPATTPGADATDLQPTGETNEMGMPVLVTPGSASGEATVAGIEVRGTTWSLGRVPLDVAVRPDWTLTNQGSSAVVLGEPHPEIREGCCPGPLSLSSSTLEPGERATLTFELSMHQGMDGWHDMLVHVPVSGAKGDDVLTLAVTGDFRN
jgi:hypothetical protein